MVLFQVAEHINDIKLGLTVYVVRGPAVFNTTVSSGNLQYRVKTLRVFLKGGIIAI